MSRTTRNSAVFISAYFFTLLLNYVFGVSLSWFFDPGQFGVLGVAQSVLLLLALLVGSGFAWTINQKIAANGVDDDNRRRFRTAFIGNLIIGIGISFLLWLSFTTGFLPWGDAYRTILPLIGITTVLLSARAVFNGAARGLYKFTPVAVNLVGEVILKILFGLILVIGGLGVTGVMIGFAIGAAISLLHSLWITRDAKWWEGSGWFDKSVIRTTAPLFLGMLSTALMLNLDVLGLKLFTPPGLGDILAGYYQAAVILSRIPVFIAQAMMLVLFSYIAGTNKLSNYDRQDLTQFLSTIFRTWFRLLLPIGLAFMLAPRAILSIFFPNEYLIASQALQVAGFGAILLALVTLLNGFLQAAGENKLPSIATGLAILLQIALMKIYISDRGTQGAALALLIASLFALLIILPNTMQFLPNHWIKGTISTKKIIALIFPFVALSIPLLLLPENNSVLALSKIIISGSIYLLTVLYLQWQPRSRDENTGHLLSELVKVFLGG